MIYSESSRQHGPHVKGALGGSYPALHCSVTTCLTTPLQSLHRSMSPRHMFGTIFVAFLIFWGSAAITFLCVINQ